MKKSDFDGNSNFPKLFLGDTRFGSVKADTNVFKSGHNTIVNVKTAHLRYPNKFLDNTMKDNPCGTSITLEGRAEKRSWFGKCWLQV